MAGFFYALENTKYDVGWSKTDYLRSFAIICDHFKKAGCEGVLFVSIHCDDFEKTRFKLSFAGD